MRSPYASFDHGPEHPDDVETVGVGFVPRTRDEILESPAFKYRFAEQIVDRMTNEQWAILAKYMDEDEAEAGRFLSEIGRPVIDMVVRWIKDDDRLLGRYVEK